MELAEVAHASDETLAKVAQRASKTKHQPAIAGPWGSVKIGVVFMLGSKRFRASAIEPTREGGEFAWVTGRYVTAQGKPSPSQITHLHCPKGERMELVDIDDVRLFV